MGVAGVLVGVGMIMAVGVFMAVAVLTFILVVMVTVIVLTFILVMVMAVIVVCVRVVVFAAVLVLVGVLMLMFVLVRMGMGVDLPVLIRVLVLVVRVGAARVDAEFDASMFLRCLRSKCMWKSPMSSLESSHSNDEGLTPRSHSAPTVMSPLIPEKQSRKRTRIGRRELPAEAGQTYHKPPKRPGIKSRRCPGSSDKAPNAPADRQRRKRASGRIAPEPTLPARLP